MKDEHITGIDLSASPISAARCASGNKASPNPSFLKAEAMRGFKNLQWPQLRRTVMKGYPCGKTLRVSIDGRMVLMLMHDELLAVRKHQPGNWLGMNQEARSHQ